MSVKQGPLIYRALNPQHSKDRVIGSYNIHHRGIPILAARQHLSMSNMFITLGSGSLVAHLVEC